MDEETKQGLSPAYSTLDHTSFHIISTPGGEQPIGEEGPAFFLFIVIHNSNETHIHSHYTTPKALAHTAIVPQTALGTSIRPLHHSSTSSLSIVFRTHHHHHHHHHNKAIGLTRSTMEEDNAYLPHNRPFASIHYHHREYNIYIIIEG